MPWFQGVEPSVLTAPRGTGLDPGPGVRTKGRLMDGPTRGWQSLSSRELEVLGLLVEGHSAKEIARILGIGPRTVESHVEHLRTKTRSRNSVHLAARAVGSGILGVIRVSAEGSSSSTDREPR